MSNYANILSRRGKSLNFDSNKTYHAPAGSTAEGASFDDIFRKEDVKEEWLRTIADKEPKIANYIEGLKSMRLSNSIWEYVCYMAIRLREMKRILKPTGSLYLHCDSTMSHYLKVLLDTIFGVSNYKNEIIWKRTGGGKGSQYSAKKYGIITDTIFFYTKSDSYSLNIYRPYSKEEEKEMYPLIDKNNRRYRTVPIYRSKSMGNRPNLCYEFRGFENKNEAGWRLSEGRMEEEYQKGNVVIKNGKIQRRKYLDDTKGRLLENIFLDVPTAAKTERTGYPTQKPLKLLERIIKASSQEGDIVLDPFCGCATTCVGAEKLGRQWIGIDVSKKAYDLIKHRIEKEVNPGLIKHLDVNEIHFRTDIPSLSVEEVTPKKYKKTLYGEQEGYCNLCRVHFHMRNLTIDHILSRKKGGRNNPENLQLLCQACNSKKGSERTNEEVRVILRKESLI